MSMELWHWGHRIRMNGTPKYATPKRCDLKAPTLLLGRTNCKPPAKN